MILLLGYRELKVNVVSFSKRIACLAIWLVPKTLSPTSYAIRLLRCHCFQLSVLDTSKVFRFKEGHCEFNGHCVGANPVKVPYADYVCNHSTIELLCADVIEDCASLSCVRALWRTRLFRFACQSIRCVVIRPVPITLLLRFASGSHNLAMSDVLDLQRS